VAFVLSPSVQIERDTAGRVRGLDHLGQPYGPLALILNEPALAEAYLHDVAATYGINPGWLNALKPTVALAATQPLQSD